jgi:zinc protease
MSARCHAARRRVALALALSFGFALAAGSVVAQPYATPPPPAAPRPLTIAAPSEMKLDNGLRLIVARREGVPLVSAELVALTGAEADPPRLAGLASLSASLMTQVTRRHSAPQLAAAAEALGGSLDSAAGWNHALVSITVTAPKLDAALALVAEVAREPVFANDEIERVRTQSLDGLKGRLRQALPRSPRSSPSVWPTVPAPTAAPPAGTPDSLPRIVRTDLVAAHRQAFRRQRSPDPRRRHRWRGRPALARRHFGSWAAPATRSPQRRAPRPIRRARPPPSST